jgi:hypothetical protein
MLPSNADADRMNERSLDRLSRDSAAVAIRSASAVLPDPRAPMMPTSPAFNGTRGVVHHDAFSSSNTLIV